MTLPLIDLVPRTKLLITKPETVTTVIVLSTILGLIEGLALSLLLPAITALSTGEPVWGLRVGGWLWVLAVLAVLSAVLGYIQNGRSYATAMDFLVNVHRKIGDQVARLPLGWFGSETVGRLSRMVSSQLMLAGEILAHSLAPLVSRLSASAVILVLSWIWDWRLGLVLTVAAPLFLLMVLASTTLMRKGTALAEPSDVELSNRIIEYAQCQGALRSAGRSTSFTELDVANRENLRIKRKQLWFELFGILLGGAMTQLVIVVLIAVAAQLAVTGALAPIPAIAFIGLSLRFTTMLTAITEAALSLEGRRPVLDTYDEVLNSPPLAEPSKSAPQPTPGSVALEAVQFGYHPETPVLRNVSLEVPARSMVALVGPSGCGKTTAVRLISRFYDVQAGAVRVGGTDVRELTTEDLMGQLSMVFQDVYLFDDTLRANIQVGRQDATAREIDEAAELAGVTEIVARLPQGWDTPVGEGGGALSGGERQRVAIARALLKQAPIVLFDEATSALDQENEGNVLAAMDKLRETSTLIVIAHKLDTIQRADRIVQFNGDGAVEDIGTHAELLERGGTYRAFWEHREAAHGWQLR